MASPDVSSRAVSGPKGPSDDSPRTLDDPQVIQRIHEYRAALEAGEHPDYDGLLAEFPEIADELGACLDALGFVHQVVPQLRDQANGVAEEKPGRPDVRPVGALGDFRIVREIGRGGMGVVYEAEQLSLGRRVALKILPFAAVLDQRQLARFKNEAQAAAQLHHQNIVPVHAVGCERGVHYYAMQFIEGHTLAEVIDQLRELSGVPTPEGQAEGRQSQNGPFEGGERPAGAGSGLASDLASGRFAPPKASSDPDAPTAAYTQDRTPGATAETKRMPQAALSTERSVRSREFFRTVAGLGVQAAEALDYAHTHGVLHRDIKPGNLILDADGKLWITDFGLAWMETEGTLTLSGDLLGTVRYMSPEQALAKRVVVDHRTDVYSLGVTLYELLTLRPAFTGRDREELLRQIAFEEPKAPRRLNKSVPAELQTVVLKAMAKNPAERYDTAGDLADDLERFLEDKPIRAKRPSLARRAAKWSRRHKPIVWSAALSMFLLLIFGLVGLGTANVMIRKERDAKDEALAEKTAALEEKTEALLSAELERRRAESNLELAMDALNAVYLEAIGRDRLFGDEHQPRAKARLSDLENRLLKTGLDFYALMASQNEDSTRAKFETATAFLQIGALQANLNESEAADAALLEAIARFEKLTESFPNEAKYFRKLGNAYLALGIHKRYVRPETKNTFCDAERAFTRAIELDPKHAQVYADRGGARSGWPLYKWEEAAEDFSRLIELNPHSGVYARRGCAHTYLGDYEQAVADCTEAIRLDPKSAVAYASRGKAYAHKGEMERAIADYNEAIRLDPPNNRHYRLRAVAHVAGGQWADAVAYFAELAKSTPETPLDDYEHACILLLTGDTEGYRQICARMLKGCDGTTNAFLANAVARTCALESNSVADPARLVQLGEQAVAANGKSPYYLHTLGMAHYRAGQFDQAVERLEQSLDIPWEARVVNWLALAMALHGRGDQEEARGWLDKVRQWTEDHNVSRQSYPTAPGAVPLGDAYDFMEYLILRCEAEQLIGPSSAESDKQSPVGSEEQPAKP